MSFDIIVKVIILYILIIIPVIYCKVKDSVIHNHKEEKVRIIYQNPKYVRYIIVVTSSNDRRDRNYVTNASCDILQSWGNNVTMYFKYTLGKNNDFEVSLPLCKGLNEKWLTDYMSRFMSQDINKCPIPAGVYNFSNIEVPPKNFPFPLPKGIYHLKTGFFITQTKDKILDVSAKVYISK